MNERIKKLVDQALFESDFDDEQNIKITMDIFAELIVRECAGVAEISMPPNSHSNERLKVKNSVLEHFGVEGLN